jgi:hypothetical protein
VSQAHLAGTAKIMNSPFCRSSPVGNPFPLRFPAKLPLQLGYPRCRTLWFLS